MPTQSDNVLFLAGDPGGASALLPVIKAWHRTKNVLAYRHAADLFAGAGVEFERLDDTRASSREALLWLNERRPGLLCAGTSVNGVDWEQHFFVASRRLDIPSVAVLDYWSNYVPRFSLAQNLDAMPDMIGIMDERAREEMIEDGFPAERLMITGQPVLDEARRWYAGLSGDSRQRFRKRLGIAAGTHAFLFISQPLVEMRRATGGKGRLFDEFASLEALAEAIGRTPVAPMLLLIKLHPREARDKYQHMVFRLPCPVRVVEPRYHRWEVCIAADRILGMDSMLLEEAQVMNCSVERIQNDVPLSLSGSRLSRDSTSAQDVPLAKDRIAEVITRYLRLETPRPT